MPFCFQQQKKKRDNRKGRRKKDLDDDVEEKELAERLKKLSVPASDEEDEGEGPESTGCRAWGWRGLTEDPLTCLIFSLVISVPALAPRGGRKAKVSCPGSRGRGCSHGPH